jgi:hypothetical protein
MWNPRILTCDLCSNTIDHEIPWARLIIPLSREDRQRIWADIEKQLPQFQGKPIQLGGLAASQMIPKVWEIELCKSCLDKGFPTVDFVKTNQIITAIERHEGYRKKHELAAAAIEDDD